MGKKWKSKSDKVVSIEDIKKRQNRRKELFGEKKTEVFIMRCTPALLDWLKSQNKSMTDYVIGLIKADIDARGGM